MIHQNCLVISVLAGLAAAAQPEAPKAIAAPMRDLPWGNLNFLATTDTHGWHAGHLQEAQYSADWGDYVSFASHLRKQADERGVDLLLVDTGDRIDGNGLYDGSNPRGKYTYDIFKHQDIDIICTGNHELYKTWAVDREYNTTVPNFKGNYLASNLDITDPKTGERVPLTKRFRKFTTKNQGIRIMSFGFIFDFTLGAKNTFVQRVEDTIQEKWFQDAIREEVDLFVVIGHVAVRSPEYKAIFTAIRKQNWDTPIQFFGGHTHIRDYTSYDSKAFALESGRYFETVGWMALDGVKGGAKTATEEIETAAKVTFQRRYIDNNLYGYYHHTGLNATTFPTELGANVSRLIHHARKEMDLDTTFGCAPKDYWMTRAEYPSNSSVYSWLVDKVLPDILVGEGRDDKPRLAIINTGVLRFDVFKGPYTKDTKYIVCPFTNKWEYIQDVPYKAAKTVEKLINAGGPVFAEAGLESLALVPPQQRTLKEDIFVKTPSQEVMQDFRKGSQAPLGLSGDNNKEPNLVPGYTTKDDAGDDGDDTVHSLIGSYKVPNVVQAEIGLPADGEPEKVDLIFLDFVRPWILLALRFSGENYAADDIQPYLAELDFTHHLEKWVSKHWKC